MAKSNFASQPSAARHVSGIFFPQRIPLRIDGGAVSPAVLEKKVLAVAYAPLYSIGELLLQIRAAALCDDNRLSNFLHSRPGHPFHPNATNPPTITSAG